MSTYVIGWIVIVVNGALVVLNSYHMFRLRRERRSLVERSEALKAIGNDFVRRVTTGELHVTTDDGQTGVLVVMPDGDGLRLSVQPPPVKGPVH